jgi:hypothetical protein
VPAADPYSELLRRTHLSVPSDIGAIIVEQARCLGARDAAISLVDYEQDTLLPFAAPAGPGLAVTGTLAGRASWS